jgi:hypothetical protein
VSVSEPTALSTDYLLAAVAVALGVRLARSVPSRDAGPRLWAAGFLVGAVAALAGGTVHGFAGSLPVPVRAGLWKTYLVGVGLANGLLLSGIAAATLRGVWLEAGLAATAGKLTYYLVVVARSDLTRDAIRDATATILLVLALSLASARRDPRRLAWLLLALAVSAAGLAAQVSGLALHPRLNHNDVCHLILTLALWPFYRAGLRLRVVPASSVHPEPKCPAEEGICGRHREVVGAAGRE